MKKLNAIEDLVLGENYTKEIPLDQRPSLSFLIGSGFSVPMGYPTGKDMNTLITNFDHQPVAFNSAGELTTTKDGSRPQMDLNPYQICFKFCMIMIHEYARTCDFDYEQFLDFLLSKEIYNSKYQLLCKKYISDFNNYEILVNNVSNIYIQMVDYLLKDSTMQSWYDDLPNQIGEYGDLRSAYNGLIKFLNSKMNNYKINVHTLNHDLLFESFNMSEFINGNISDGFDDYRSKYYGTIKYKGVKNLARLERYTGRYDQSPIRLYKLHGSINYAVYHRQSNNGVMIPAQEVKLHRYINPLTMVCEKSNHRGYDHDFLYYHADFLTGTTSKMREYNSRVFYKKMFNKFRNNLKNAQALIILGYGGKDEGINKYIYENFDYKNKPSFVVDKYLSSNKKLVAFANKLNANKLEMDVDEITKDTFKF